jgi:hypothetical protein
VLAILLGLVLLTATVLKGYQIVTETVPGRGAFSSQWFLLGVVGFELGLGLWLLAGLHPASTRWVTLACFGCYLGVALNQVWSGEVSCGCLGKVAVTPQYMLIFDLVAIAALWVTRPAGSRTFRSFPRPLALCLLLLLLAGATGAIIVKRTKPPGLVPTPQQLDLGAISQGGRREQTFWLTNRGSSLIEVATVKTTCPCVRVELADNVIGPSERIPCRTILDLGEEKDFVGNLGMEVIGFTPAGHRAFFLRIGVKVRRGLTLED